MTNLLQPPTGEEMMPGEDQPIATQIDKEDGRNLRRQRNREAVIRALIELIREGDLSPTVGRIADRAELSHRSVFRYFDDLDDLARTAIETEFREALPLSRVNAVGEGTRDERIERIVDAQIRTMQRTHLLGLVARARALEIAEVGKGMKRMFGLHRDQVAVQFDRELAEMDDATSATIATAIALATWLDNYDLLRRVGERSDDEIATMWRITLHALLDSPTVGAGSHATR